MRDRLITLIKDIAPDMVAKCGDECDNCVHGDCVGKLADHLMANGVVVLPCKVGDWIWYVYRNEVNKAKVEEIQYDASKHGYYSYSFRVYAYDFKNKRQVSYYPINETQKNKSNINEVEGMDFDEDVYVFFTREEAKKALAERSENEPKR